MKAMILAAGLGTRFRPLTDTLPKALIPVRGQPLLGRLIQNLKKSGYNEIVINTHHLAGQIEKYLQDENNFNIKIQLTHEPEILDTGGGLKNAESLIAATSPFLLHNVDILTTLNLADLHRVHHDSGALVTLFVRNRKTSRYLLFDQHRQLCGWKDEIKNETRWVNDEKPGSEIQQWAFSGVHYISPAIFKLMPPVSRYSIIDVYLELAARFPIKAYLDDQVFWLDVGKPESLRQADQSDQII